MKRMNFPGRKEKRQLEAIERQKHTKIENTRKFRLAQKKQNKDGGLNV